jgi:hypothetical protein
MGRPYRNKPRLTNVPVGNERRENLLKNILSKGTFIPKSTTYKDIDETFKNFVNENIKISYEGELIPTYVTYSIQRFSEYAQMWGHTDENGNLFMNFKLVLRENNPQPGQVQGGLFNVPNNKFYPITTRIILDDNGTESYERYSMRIPVATDLIYSVQLVTNKYELLNKMNELVVSLFRSLQFYIYPNGYPMPLKLDSISDESEYDVEQFKFYSQTYNIKCMAYIINDDDFKIETFPKRKLVMFEGESNKKPNIVFKDFQNKKISIEITFSYGEDIVTFDFDANIRITSAMLKKNIRLYSVHRDDDLLYIDNGYNFYNGNTIRIKIQKFIVNQPSILILEGEYTDEFTDGKVPEDLKDSNIKDTIVIN